VRAAARPVLPAVLCTLYVEASCRQGRQRADSGIGLDGDTALPHCVAEPVDEGLKSASVVAETRRALVDPGPEPGQIDIPEVGAEFALQHRLPDFGVGGPSHFARQPIVGQNPVKGAPRRAGVILQVGQDEAHAQLLAQRQVGKLEQVQRAVEWIVRAPVVDDGRGAVDLQQLVGAERFRQPDDLIVVGEEMVVELLQRPVPACPPLESGCQPAEDRPAFKQVDLDIAGAGELVGGGKPSDPASDDADAKGSVCVCAHYLPAGL